MQRALARLGVLHVLGTDAHNHVALRVALVGQLLAAAVQGDVSRLYAALQKLYLAHKVRNEGIGGLIVDHLGGAHLLDNAPVDDHDAVAHGHGLGLVVGDVHHGDAVLLLNVLDLKAHALAQLCVQIGQRLVQKKQGGFGHQRPGQRNALLLAAGQLAGDPVPVLGQMHHVQHALHFLRDGGFIHLLDLQRVGHVVEHGHVGPYGVALEHHADVPLFRGNEHLVGGDHPVVEKHAAAGGLFKPGDDAQHGGFAAARRAQQGDEFAVGEHGVKVFQHRGVAEGLGHVLNGYAGHDSNSFLWEIPLHLVRALSTGGKRGYINRKGCFKMGWDG